MLVFRHVLVFVHAAAHMCTYMWGAEDICGSQFSSFIMAPRIRTSSLVAEAFTR